MTYIIHVRYGIKSSELRNATEIIKNNKKQLENVLDDVRKKYEDKLDVPFPIVDIWKISKM